MMNNRAFTLIELVVAISIISVVMALTVGILLSVKQTKSGIMQGADFAAQSRIIIERVAAELRGLPSNETGRYYFEGGKHHLSFTSLSSFERQGTPAKVHYRFAQHGDKASLAIYGDSGQSLMNETGLAIARIEISYFNGTNWSDNWPAEASSPPTAVRILLSSSMNSEQGLTYQKIVGIVR